MLERSIKRHIDKVHTYMSKEIHKVGTWYQIKKTKLRSVLTPLIWSLVISFELFHTLCFLKESCMLLNCIVISDICFWFFIQFCIEGYYLSSKWKYPFWEKKTKITLCKILVMLRNVLFNFTKKLELLVYFRLQNWMSKKPLMFFLNLKVNTWCCKTGI